MYCVSCGDPITTTKGVAYEIKGWERERKEGGTNHVLWRERTGKFMCSACVVKKTYGVSDDQLTIA